MSKCESCSHSEFQGRMVEEIKHRIQSNEINTKLFQSAIDQLGSSELLGLVAESAKEG